MANDPSTPQPFGIGRAAEVRRHTPRASSAFPTDAPIEPTGARFSAPRSHLILLELEGPQPGAVFSIGAHTLLGRSGEADVSIGDGTVSVNHARLTVVDGAVYLEDLGSRNGTFVNGRRVRGSTRLADGDYLRVGGGSTVLKFSTVDELEERAHRMLFELTLRDPLTRLYNRRYFDDRLSSEFAFAQRHRAELALLLIDIDHFKQFNDSCGHQVGDVVLRLVASSIQAMMRPEDVLARYGGEEFVVIARATSARNMEILGDRLCRQIASLPLELPGRELNVTVSIGVSYTSCDVASDSAEALLHAADMALFEAKAGGRNRAALAARLR